MTTQTECTKAISWSSAILSSSPWLPLLSAIHTPPLYPIICCRLYNWVCALLPTYDFGIWGQVSYCEPLPVFLVFGNSFLHSFFYSWSNFLSLLHARHNTWCFWIWLDFSSPFPFSCFSSYSLGAKLIGSRELRCFTYVTINTITAQISLLLTLDIMDLFTVLSPLVSPLLAAAKFMPCFQTLLSVLLAILFQWQPFSKLVTWLLPAQLQSLFVL